MRLLLLSIIVILGVVEINTWQIFHLGRRTSGAFHRIETFKNATEEYFTQKLDHFNPTDTRIWQQRFFTSDQFYNRNGVVFLKIGGESQASDSAMESGSWVDYAKRFGALLFQLEHRFYGKSHPTEDMSTENLKYLSSEQALSDLATFIVAMNKKHKLPPNTKWIAFGGSYAGSLAAWLRLKHPDLVHAAVSASGPLLAQADFKDFFRVVAASLATYNKKCPIQVQKGFQQIDSLIRSEEGRSKLDRAFNLCDSLQKTVNNPNDVTNFYDAVAQIFAGVVQNNLLAFTNIDEVCDAMLDKSLGEPFERLGQVTKIVISKFFPTCLAYQYDDMISAFQRVNWKSSISAGGRQWFYQMCNEFGFFQTTTYQPQIFSNQLHLDFFIQQCQDVFGKNFNSTRLNRGIDRTNKNYGGLNINVNNVVFVHSSIDPWHPLGITKTVNPEAPAIYIEGTSHCAIMYSADDDDPPQLTAARKQLGELIGKWLQ